MKTKLNKRSASYIALFLILVFVPFMVFANKPPEKKPGGFELSLSQSILFDAIKKYGKPVQNVELNKYLNLVGNSIAKNTDPEIPPFSFVIIKSPEVFSFGTPARIIVISSQLLSSMKNESQLACVLGREIALVLKKSTLRSIDKSKLIDVKKKKSKKAKKKANKKNFKKIMKQLGSTLFAKGFGTKKELRGDKAGMRFAYITGYNPNGLYQLLKILEKDKTGKGKWFNAVPLNQRIKKCKNNLAKYKDLKGINNNKSRFNKYVSLLN